MEGLAETRLQEITQLLREWAAGDQHALEQATELVYAELRRIAAAYLRQERSSHTLQPTALIHEAYLRLARIEPTNFEGRKQFLALAARIMRQVLVDHARQTGALKRGGELTKVQLQDTLAFGSSNSSNSLEFLILDQALSRLAELNPRKAQVIELRYFGGLGIVEISEIMEVSPATVSREQRLAEAWLAEALNAGGEPK
jgi:RNA polymerase sigma-70 factor (ECF subfamily)